MGRSVSINKNKRKIFYSYYIIVFYYHSYDYCDNIHSTDRLSSGLLFVMFVEKSLAIGYGTFHICWCSCEINFKLFQVSYFACWDVLLNWEKSAILFKAKSKHLASLRFSTIFSNFRQNSQIFKNSQGTSLKVRDLIFWILALYMRMSIWAPVKTKFANSIQKVTPHVKL